MAERKRKGDKASDAGTRAKADRVKKADAGTYIGRLPEHAADTIPGGLTRKDGRVSAFDTQTGAKSPEPETPEGHREGDQTTDDTIREAGENR
jgi:hypothetical protein